MFNNFENTEDINKVSTVPRAHEHSRFTMETILKRGTAQPRRA
jgi:hypothetical protein